MKKAGCSAQGAAYSRNDVDESKKVGAVIVERSPLKEARDLTKEMMADLLGMFLMIRDHAGEEGNDRKQ